MRAALPFLLAALVPAAPAARSADADADLARSLVRRVEERHARTADLVARFTQSYRSGMLGREVVERGVVSIKRPGRMRWEYKDPEAKLFVSDGRTFYFYVPADQGEEEAALLCPKLVSTNPGTDVYEIPEGKTKADLQDGESGMTYLFERDYTPKKEEPPPPPPEDKKPDPKKKKGK